MKKLKLKRKNYSRMKVIRYPNTPKSFLELLESGVDLDCDLIIGNAEMPASFVWDEHCQISGYGIEKYRPLMDAPIRRLPGGNIELLCDDEELGEEFCLAAAGYIGEVEYRKIFGVDDAAA